MVYILLGNGFEEAEALVACDILRRGGLAVSLVSVSGDRAVTGGHGIVVRADDMIDELEVAEADTIVIPGGMGGVDSIKSSADAQKVILAAAGSGALLTAICAGPAILASLGLLEGKRITCYPGCEGMMTGAKCDASKSVVSSGQILTGRAPGSAFDFGLAILESLTDKRTAASVRAELVIK